MTSTETQDTTLRTPWSIRDWMTPKGTSIPELIDADGKRIFMYGWYSASDRPELLEIVNRVNAYPMLIAAGQRVINAWNRRGDPGTISDQDELDYSITDVLAGAINGAMPTQADTSPALVAALTAARLQIDHMSEYYNDSSSDRVLAQIDAALAGTVHAPLQDVLTSALYNLWMEATTKARVEQMYLEEAADALHQAGIDLTTGKPS